MLAFWLHNALTPLQPAVSQRGFSADFGMKTQELVHVVLDLLCCFVVAFLMVYSPFCSLLHLPEASTQSLISIYSTHLRMSEVNRFSQNFLEYIPKIAACSVFVLHEVRANLTPSPLKPHYIFCLKDISKVSSTLESIIALELKLVLL